MNRRNPDVIIVGAGINGAGVAQAVAAAGHSVLVLEKSAPAAGTSSKSSKLVHGGLRYLESLEFGLVRESLCERALLLKLAPELVQLQDFYIPVYESARRSPLLLRAGLSLYWTLTGFDRNGRFNSVPRSRWPELDGLRTSGLRAVLRYRDARTDDALLTGAVLQSAAEHGARVEFPARFIQAELRPDGCLVRYSAGAKEYECMTRTLVNAAGPWVNEVAARVVPEVPMLPISLVQGAHIEVAGSMGERFFYLESPRDGRAVFVMPRDGRIIIGTTETSYSGNPDNVHALRAEEGYLLSVLRHYFPATGGPDGPELLTSWAGLRVLPGGQGHAFHKSRETILYADRREKPRFLSVYGGKLTTYRTTASKVLRRITSSLPVRRGGIATDQLPLRPPV